MGWVSGIAVYLIVWWTVLFMVLPWGAHKEDNPEPGHAASAPARPMLKLKFMVTTGLAAVVWGVIYLVVQSGVIDLYMIADRMSDEERS